jgi:hypothetical protein
MGQCTEGGTVCDGTAKVLSHEDANHMATEFVQYCRLPCLCQEAGLGTVGTSHDDGKVPGARANNGIGRQIMESELENIRPATFLEVTTRPIWKPSTPRRLRPVQSRGLQDWVLLLARVSSPSHLLLPVLCYVPTLQQPLI